MNRRHVLLLLVTSSMLAFAALGSQRKSELLLLEWASKAPAKSSPVAILIELGLRDDKPASWSGRATVTGAKVIHREGYRFRDGDRLVEPNAWEASTHAQPQRPKAVAKAKLVGAASVGIVLHLNEVTPEAVVTVERTSPAATAKVALKDVLAGQTAPLFGGTASVRVVSTATPVVTAKTEDDFPVAAYGPDGTLWLAYISYTLKDENRRLPSGQLKEQPGSFKDYYTPEFGDQLFVKYYRGGKWSQPIAVTGPREDLVRCAVAVEGNGTVGVAYSANRKGNYDLYARSIRPGADGAEPRLGPEQKVTSGGTPHLGPVLCTDQNGHLRGAYQGWDEKGRAMIIPFRCRNASWGVGVGELNTIRSGYFLPGDGNSWNPALSAGPNGEWAVAYDSYQRGDYDIMVSVFDAKGIDKHFPVATSPRFEARPAIAYDAQGRLWVAYEEGPEKWGKDFGALEKEGNPLYNARTVRVVCLDNGKVLRAPDVPAPAGRPIVNGGRTAIYSSPRVGIDGTGRIWLSYRQKLQTPFGTAPGTSWVTVARRLEGDQWSEPIDLHHSDGTLDSRPVVLPRSGGGLLVLHNTDGRYVAPGILDNQIYASVLNLPGDPAEPKLVAHEAGTKDPKAAEQERDDIRRIREYRIDAGGNKYQFLRGEFHRHTEISFDGGNDGSLEDLFRYAIDAAAMDWIGNGDHDNGGGREYTWWQVQKLTDAYQVKKVFTPMFTYERSVAYPHGHRNCMFAQRGVRTLPRLAPTDATNRVANAHADDAKMLYRYLRELGGICASHTSATSMGTDWRDNDPIAEPIVEIYQGDRNSYEYEDAPRSGHDPQGNKLPASIGGWEPAGFVINALQKKGYRLGFQASSDHISTHISYCIALAESHDREAILSALKKRHCYGATDNIIVDVRSGSHLMGDEFKTSSAPALQITVIGTRALARIDILKDSEIVQTIKPAKQEYRGSWTDPTPAAGVHYYYVRVVQEDEELAWASPMWVDYTK